MQTPGPATETVIGGTLLTSPYWAAWLHDINLFATTIATVGGAIMAIHGVVRIIVGLVERRRSQQPDQR
jgi:hypothetical protein